MRAENSPTKCPLTDEQWDAFFDEYSLSPREGEIVRDIVERDQCVSETARNLAIAIDTVRTHQKRLYHKLDVQSRVGVVMTVFRWFVDFTSKCQ